MKVIYIVQGHAVVHAKEAPPHSYYNVKKNDGTKHTMHIQAVNSRARKLYTDKGSTDFQMADPEGEEHPLGDMRAEAPATPPL